MWFLTAMSMTSLRLVQRHAAAGLGIELGARKAAEIAVGIANVGDGKLEIARPAVVQDFADEFEHAFLWARRPAWKNQARPLPPKRIRLAAACGAVETLLIIN